MSNRRRRQSAAQLRAELQRLLDPSRPHEEGAERLRAQVHKYVEQPHVQHSTQSNAIIQGLLGRIHKVADQTKSKMGDAFEVSQTGYMLPRTVAKRGLFCNIQGAQERKTCG
jgi:hypothetical protein